MSTVHVQTSAASVAASPVMQSHMPAATVDDQDFIGNFWSLRYCKETGNHLLRNGTYSSYECINGSWLPWDWYELWAW
jgi:hypothetical protein